MLLTIASMPFARDCSIQFKKLRLMSILCDCVHCASDGRVEEGVQSDLKQADMVYFKPLVDESKN